jgi:hypothetical protein
MNNRSIVDCDVANEVGLLANDSFGTDLQCAGTERKKGGEQR